jgi:DNA-binding response OmpR family regulator
MKHKTILVADDERMTRRMLEAMLTAAGYTVITAEDGQAAVEMAASELPDLVLIDGLLPKLHGFLACKAIKAFDNPPKVIILTGVYTKPTYRYEVKNDYNADEILKKPAKRDELLACIEKHLAETFDETDIPQQAFIAAQSPIELTEQAALVLHSGLEIPHEAIIAAQPEMQTGFAFAEQI